MPENSDVSVVTTAGALRSLCVQLREAGRFAFDTEFVSEYSFEPELCLIQVATADHLAVIDPLALGDLSPFWDVLLDPKCEVVMHAAGEDLRIAHRHTHDLPTRLVDVQLAAGFAGFSYPLSLGNLLSHVLGVSVVGSETRTDWRRRPLSAGQLRYAADDVRHLLAVADNLWGRLDRLGRRDWYQAEQAQALEAIRNRDDDRWRRLPGLHQLSRRGREAARRLADWRAADARRANRPLRQILRDDLLIAIAKRLPETRHELEALRDFQRPALLKRSDEILQVLAEARDVPDHALPEQPERPDDAPGAAMIVGLLNATLHQICSQQQLAPSLVGTVSDLKELIRWYNQGEPDAWTPALLRGWRRDVCGETLREVLAGRRALRVVDPAAELPVALDPIRDPTGPNR